MTHVYKYQGSQNRIVLSNQDNPNLQNASETKLSVTSLYDKHYRFLFLISQDDSINFLSVSKNVNYLENCSDSTYKSLAQQSYTHSTNVPTKFDMNCLVSFEVIPIFSF